MQSVASVKEAPARGQPFSVENKGSLLYQVAFSELVGNKAIYSIATFWYWNKAPCTLFGFACKQKSVSG